MGHTLPFIPPNGSKRSWRTHHSLKSMKLGNTSQLPACLARERSAHSARMMRDGKGANQRALSLFQPIGDLKPDNNAGEIFTLLLKLIGA